MAVKQLIPEHEIGTGSFKLAANYLPLVYISVVTVFTLLRLISLGDLAFTLAAFQTSWLFLRYFQTRNGVRGDMSESFSYSSLFPEPLRTFVAIFSNLTFVMFKPILLAGQTSRPDIEPSQTAAVSKAASIEAERRRQRALKALDERMNATAQVEERDEPPV